MIEKKIHHNNLVKKKDASVKIMVVTGPVGSIGICLSIVVMHKIDLKY